MYLLSLMVTINLWETTQINYKKCYNKWKQTSYPEDIQTVGFFQNTQLIRRRKKKQREKDKSEKSHTCRKMGIILMQSIEVVTNLKNIKIIREWRNTRKTRHLQLICVCGSARVDVYRVRRICYFPIIS